jgi:hypothetical protein
VALELAVAVPVPAADADDDEVGAAAADDVDDDVLLLPQPTMAAAHTSGRAADSHVLIERIALLLIESQKQCTCPEALRGADEQLGAI